MTDLIDRTSEYMKLYRYSVELAEAQPCLKHSTSISIILKAESVTQAFVQLERGDLMDHEFELLKEFLEVVKLRLDAATRDCEKVLDAAVKRCG